jgi:DNA-binding transcriptional LysR family regulator
VRSGEIDIGFVHPPLDHRGLNVRYLQRDEFLVALSRGHPAAGRAKVSLRDFADERWIRLPSPPSAYRTDRGLDTIRLGGFEPRIVAEVTQVSLLLRLVADGVGVGMATSGYTAGSGVVFKRLSENVPELELEAVWRSGETPTPALSSFLSLLDDWGGLVPKTPSVTSSRAESASRRKGHGLADRPSRSGRR